MHRLFAVGLGCLFVFSFAGVSSAEHHHKEWWKYMTGTWITESSFNGGEPWKNTVTRAMAPTGEALTAQLRGEDGSSAYEVEGWQREKNMLVLNGYGSEGNNWQLEYDKIGEDTMEGNGAGVLPDGMIVRGKIVLQKVDADQYTLSFDGKRDDGEAWKLSIKAMRKKDNGGN